MHSSFRWKTASPLGIGLSIRACVRVVVWALGLLSLAAATPLAGCEPLAAPELALTSATPPLDFETALARAHAARDRAALLRAPAPADLASGSDDAIADALRRWAASRRDATQDAHRGYAEALLSAREPAEEATVYGELAELWLGVEEDTRSALFAATPAEYRDDPSLVSAVQGATVYALRPLLDRVESHLSACDRILREIPSPAAPGPGTDAARICAAVAQRLKDADDPRGVTRSEASDGPSASREVAEIAPRAVLPTTHPKPCTFKGTLFARGTIYASESGTSPLLTTEPWSPLEVESLAVPTAPGGRYKVSVSWPKAVDGYLETEDGPFVLRRQVDLGSDSVWAAEGERVGASDARGPTVLVARPKHVGSEPAASSAGPDPVDRRLFCHDLELATPLHTHGPSDPSR